MVGNDPFFKIRLINNQLFYVFNKFFRVIIRFSKKISYVINLLE
ncbi:hypothetical protein QW060_20645 [Myroides ceti]|uniref:Uncharacterized protein n=1 Tax=Paenimyroides ceti TaxID=395087 RepID=A0ABT8CZ85_9FLAO|nr:hypothetical protein [Paenimyroides ceti]MDN3709421.1 hypothetical protein [Paenimyroides ceti]